MSRLFRVIAWINRQIDGPFLRDRWRHDSPRNELKRGLRESAEGKAEYIGSFAQYADEARRNAQGES